MLRNVHFLLKEARLEIKNVSLFNEAELIKELRQIPLLSSNSIFPYRETEIFLTETNPCQDNIKPTSLYIYKDRLSFHRELLHNFLEQHQIDLRSLNRIIKYQIKEKNYSLIPPVLEFSEEDKCWLIVDGRHRLYLAYQEKNPLHQFTSKGKSKLPFLFFR